MSSSHYPEDISQIGVAKFIATFMYYLYLLKSLKDHKLYIGFTSNLSRRLREHNAGEVFSTKGRRPLELIYCEVYKSLADARRRERNLKLFSTAYNGLKARLIDSL